jgi:hypothetical protein
MPKPSPKANLLLYIATTDTAVSAVLVEEQMEADTLKQFPIYYASEALSGLKLSYSEMEKMAYTVVMPKRKLQHYFQSHNILVPTAFPLRDMFENKESTGRIDKWATELAEHVINFVSHSAIKSLVFADFVADWTPSVTKGTHSLGAGMGSSMRKSILSSGLGSGGGSQVALWYQALVCTTAELRQLHQ